MNLFTENSVPNTQKERWSSRITIQDANNNFAKSKGDSDLFIPYSASLSNSNNKNNNLVTFSGLDTENCANEHNRMSSNNYVGEWSGFGKDRSNLSGKRDNIIEKGDLNKEKRSNDDQEMNYLGFRGHTRRKFINDTEPDAPADKPQDEIKLQNQGSSQNKDSSRAENGSQSDYSKVFK